MNSGVPVAYLTRFLPVHSLVANFLADIFAYDGLLENFSDFLFCAPCKPFIDCSFSKLALPAAPKRANRHLSRPNDGRTLFSAIDGGSYNGARFGESARTLFLLP